jgi:hypothetical protein
MYLKCACVADQSNSSVEKAGVLGSVTMRLLPSDHKCRLRGATLEQAIKDDRDKGLIPFYVSIYTMLSKEYNPMLLHLPLPLSGFFVRRTAKQEYRKRVVHKFSQISGSYSKILRHQKGKMRQVPN